MPNTWPKNAYDDLPDATKRRIDGLKAVHVFESKYSPRSLGILTDESRKKLPPPGTHPSREPRIGAGSDTGPGFMGRLCTAF